MAYFWFLSGEAKKSKDKQQTSAIGSGGRILFVAVIFIIAAVAGGTYFYLYHYGEILTQ